MTTRPSPTAIERIDVFGYDLTYAHGEYVMSSGRVIDRLRSTGGGRGPAAGARGAPLGLGPAGLGSDVTEPATVDRRMDGALKGHRYAKSAIDVACWDAFGRSIDRSIAV